MSFPPEVGNAYDALMDFRVPRGSSRTPAVVLAETARKNPITAADGVSSQLIYVMNPEFAREAYWNRDTIWDLDLWFAQGYWPDEAQLPLYRYLLRIIRLASDEISNTAGVVNQLKVKQLSKSGMFGKDMDATLLRSYFTKSEDRPPVEAFKASLIKGAPGRLATGPEERGFTRRRTLPPPPGGRGPAAAGAPQGGRKKTTRLPSRSSRRRRSTRSQRNRGGAKSP
jgi:hypothetical protein